MKKNRDMAGVSVYLILSIVLIVFLVAIYSNKPSNSVVANYETQGRINFLKPTLTDNEVERLNNALININKLIFGKESFDYEKDFLNINRFFMEGYPLFYYMSEEEWDSMLLSMLTIKNIFKEYDSEFEGYLFNSCYDYSEDCVFEIGKFVKIF